MRAAAVGLVLAILPGLALAGDYRAIDGDTLRVRSTGERVRFLGVDAPELHPCRCAYECRLGIEARDMVQAALDRGPVEIERHGRDRYRRTLARVLVDGKDLAALLIESGHGRVYRGERRRPWCQ